MFDLRVSFVSLGSLLEVAVPVCLESRILTTGLRL